MFSLSEARERFFSFPSFNHRKWALRRRSSGLGGASLGQQDPGVGLRMLPFKWLFHFFSLLGCPANGLPDPSWGEKKALLLKLVDGLVLDLDNAFILLSQAFSAAKTNRGEGRERDKHIIQQLQVIPDNPRSLATTPSQDLQVFKIRTEVNTLLINTSRQRSRMKQFED